MKSGYGFHAEGEKFCVGVFRKVQNIFSKIMKFLHEMITFANSSLIEEKYVYTRV